MWCKGLLLCGMTVIAAMTSGFAADLKPVRKEPPRATAAAPLPPSWAGFYAGPTLGWAKGRSEGFYQGTGPTPPPTTPTAPTIVATPTTPITPTTPTTPTTPAANAPITDITAINCTVPQLQQFLIGYFFGCILDPITPGALAGYNFQFGSLVAGVEADAGWIGRHSPQVPAPDTSGRWDQFGVTWTGHVRGRVGYAFGQYLPFVAGGLALAGYNVAHFRSDATGSVLYTANDTRVGYTIGGGVEIANLFPSFLPGWVFRGEYLYDHFNPRQYDWVPGMRYTVLDLTIHTLRAAATYRFSTPH